MSGNTIWLTKVEAKFMSDLFMLWIICSEIPLYFHK